MDSKRGKEEKSKKKKKRVIQGKHAKKCIKLKGSSWLYKPHGTILHKDLNFEAKVHRRAFLTRNRPPMNLAYIFEGSHWADNHM